MRTYKNFISYFLLLISGILLTIGVIKLPVNNNNKADAQKVSLKKEIDIKSVISSYAKNKELLSENDINDEFVSLLTKDNDVIESYIINYNTGKEMKFDEIIKNDSVDLFWNKVYDLLALKYPKFIVDGLKNPVGRNTYEIKSSEMIISFYNYEFEPSYDSNITIRVNYNEVHDYLDFTHSLDSDYENESGYNYDKNKKTIALTFDDGPSGNYTKTIVDALADNKMHATFFMVGNKMYNYKDALLYTYNSGNEIGSHTYGHINMKKKTIDEINNELLHADNVYNSLTGGHFQLIRPPYGAYDDKILDNINYPFIVWNVDTNDWRYHDVDRIVNHIMDNVSDGSIVLMHDSYKTSVEAVKKVLPKLYVAGYQVVSVSELASMKGETIEKNNVYSYFK